MDYVITKNILLSNKHVMKKNGVFQQCTNYPDDIMVYDDKFLQKNCIKSLLKINGITEVDTKRFQKYRNALSFLPNDEVLLSEYICNNEYRQYVFDIINIIEKAINSDCYYFSWFRKYDVLFDALQDSLIDKKNIISHLKNKIDLQNNVLKNFIPSNSGYLKKPEYNRIETRTGRLSIKNDANVLVLNKKYRDIFKSRFKHGKILSLDFSSLETRIFMDFAGIKNIPADVYGYIKNQLFQNKNVGRDVIKKIVISLMYGASNETILKSLEHISYQECLSAIKMIKEYIKFNECSEKMIEKIDGEYIRNLYGRKVLTEKHNVINSYIQSTGVDVALNGFVDIVNKNDDKKFVPLFVIHDALIADVEDGYDIIINNKIDNIDCSFPINITEFFKGDK